MPLVRFAAIVLAALAASCAQAATGDPALMREADAFLDTYTETYVALYTASSAAEWRSNTHIVPGDETNTNALQKANETLAAFVGSEANIKQARALLARKDELSDLQRRQLEAVLYAAANKPAVVADLVSQRIAAEARQSEKLFGFEFKLDGRAVTTNDLDGMLKTETDVARRRAAWESSKEVGRELRSGLAELQRLRNATVQALGYDDFFSYQVSEYGMSRAEMMELCDRLVEELRPLYRELHTWARYELAGRYDVPVPEMLPAHWLPNRWGQDWSTLVDVEGFDLDGALRDKPARWLVEQAERFYVSLGFESLPASFWADSSLYPLPADSAVKKNNHASAWHMNLDRDVRCLMSIEPNAEWFETTHHELGHIYYYLCYTNPEVPPLLRGGANRAYHEAVGSLLGLAAMQPRFAAAVGLVGEGSPDPIRTLLKEALNFVVFIPWSAGVMTRFEHDLYAENLAAKDWNARWWDLAREYQGIEPPSSRSSELCDAATKTHINDDAAQYYDYALSYILLFQLHDHIAREILHENPRDTNYYGREDVGAFLRSILKPGATRDWRELLRETTGQELSAEPMLSYFAPLLEWLRRENAGRKHTL